MHRFWSGAATCWPPRKLHSTGGDLRVPVPQHKGLLLVVHSPQGASAVSFQTSLTNSIFHITSCIGGAGTWGGLHTDLLGCGLLMGYLEPRPQHPPPPECCLGCPNPAPPAGPSDPPYRGHLLAVQEGCRGGRCGTHLHDLCPQNVSLVGGPAIDLE